MGAGLLGDMVEEEALHVGRALAGVVKNVGVLRTRGRYAGRLLVLLGLKDARGNVLRTTLAASPVRLGGGQHHKAGCGEHRNSLPKEECLDG